MPVCPFCDTPQRVDADGCFRFHGELGVVCDGVGERYKPFDEVATRDAPERRWMRERVDYEALKEKRRIKRDDFGREIL